MDRRYLEGTLRESAKYNKTLVDKYTLDQLIESFHNQDSDPNFQKIIRIFEGLILLVHTNFAKYTKTRVDLYLHIANSIEEFKLHQKFLKLLDSYSVDASGIRNVMYNELADFWLSLGIINGEKVLVGYDRVKQSFIYVESQIDNRDSKQVQSNYDYYRGKISEQQLRKLNDRDDWAALSEYSIRDRNLNGISMLLSAIINERLLDYVTVNPHLYLEGKMGDLNANYDWCTLVEAMKLRQKLLPAGGVNLTLFNFDIWKELRMIETFTLDDDIVLLFKLTDNANRTYSAAFRPLTADDIESLHVFQGEETIVEGFLFVIAEIYVNLTNPGVLDRDRRRRMLTQPINDPKEVKNSTNLYYIMEELPFWESSDGTRAKGKQKPHYRGQTTRKLPTGWHRSEEAVEKARRYGIKLKDGETFVPEYSVGLPVSKDKLGLKDSNVF